MSVAGKDGKKYCYCDFCGKAQHEVEQIIAGPIVHICDECVELCRHVIEQVRSKSMDISEAHPS